jgi:hypothetical protein
MLLRKDREALETVDRGEQDTRGRQQQFGRCSWGGETTEDNRCAPDAPDAMTIGSFGRGLAQSGDAEMHCARLTLPRFALHTKVYHRRAEPLARQLFVDHSATDDTEHSRKRCAYLCPDKPRIHKTSHRSLRSRQTHHHGTRRSAARPRAVVVSQIAQDHSGRSLGGAPDCVSTTLQGRGTRCVENTRSSRPVRDIAYQGPFG